MGLGGAAEGGTTVLALALLALLAGAVVVGALVLRWTTGRWRASAWLVAGAVALTAVVGATSYYGGDATEQRAARTLRDEVGDAVELELGAGSLAMRTDRRDCADGESTGWVASGNARYAGRAGDPSAAEFAAVAERVEPALQDLGFETAVQLPGDGPRPSHQVLGRRGEDMVLVVTYDYGSVFVQAERGCVELDVLND